ncbi:MAG: hypothetical protein NC110_02630 [Ruminococcus sp.]|nr:hypothetical protein [Ruminococcus sp.]
MKIVRYFIVPLMAVIAVFAGIAIGLNMDEKSMFGSFQPNLEQVGDTIPKGETLEKILNHNPIDEHYQEKLDSADYPSDQAEIVVEWTEAYNKEIEAAYVKLDELLDSFANDDNSHEIRQAKKSIKAMKKSYEKYAKDYADFVFDYQMAAIGYGTGIHAATGLNDVRKAREILFELAETIFSYTGEFNFQFDIAHDSN